LELNDPGTKDLRLQGKEEEFEKLFAECFGNLYSYAFSITKDAATAEEIIQTVLCLIWEKRERLEVNSSLKAYLFGCVYHECMNLIRHKKRHQAYRSHILQNSRSNMAESAAAGVELGELEKRLYQAINELPLRCKAIFFLSRFSQLGYREIASQLGISVKTVEAQMSKALRHLRKRLADFL
jgi:RNA polymerase sigma-70 factor (ECF subfamily)